MGKIKRVAAAGFYIPLAPPVGTENLFAQLQDILRQLHPNSRILLIANSLSFVTYSPQNPPVLLPLKTVCLAWDTPLSSISGRKRYNTLYFASKIVCQVELRPLWIPLPRATLFPFGYPMPTGMLLATIGNPEPKGLCPSGRPTCPCSSDPSCSHTIDTLLPGTGKTGPEFCPNSG